MPLASVRRLRAGTCSRFDVSQLRCADCGFFDVRQMIPREKRESWLTRIPISMKTLCRFSSVLCSIALELIAAPSLREIPPAFGPHIQLRSSDFEAAKISAWS